MKSAVHVRCTGLAFSPLARCCSICPLSPVLMLSHVSSSSHQLSSTARWASSCDTFFSHFQCCHHPFHQARFPAAFSFATVAHPAFFVIACLTPRPHTARRVIPFSDFQVNKVLPVGSFHRASSIPIWQPRSA